ERGRRAEPAGLGHVRDEAVRMGDVRLPDGRERLDVRAGREFRSRHDADPYRRPARPRSRAAVKVLARLRADALACWSAALDAADAVQPVGRHLARRDDALVLRSAAGATVAEHRGPAVVVGAGKAAVAMARAAADIAGTACTGGSGGAPH